MSICERGQHCTCFIDKIGKYYHGMCCQLHDYNYVRQHISRKEADKRLLKCLKKNTYKPIAYSMYYAVRTFGFIFWNRAKR